LSLLGPHIFFFKEIPILDTNSFRFASLICYLPESRQQNHQIKKGKKPAVYKLVSICISHLLFTGEQAAKPSNKEGKKTRRIQTRFDLYLSFVIYRRAGSKTIK
jgi:hypothetical protein